MKNNLVVVRAGENSLHPGWIARPYAERNFDLLISFFSEVAFDAHEPAEGVQAVLVKGGKWDGLYKTLVSLDGLDAYDRVWLPDDDIATDCDTINRMFDLSRHFGLSVCQPSLARDSYFTHMLFSRCQSFRVRFTNHVEIMVPCLDRALLKRALPQFKSTMSGYGLDYIWCRFPESGAFKCGILDEVSVHHTRPIGSQLRKAIGSTGTTSQLEEVEIKKQFGITRRIVPLAYAGLTTDGEAVTGMVRMGYRMYRDWTSDLPSFADARLARSKALQVFKRQIIRNIDWSGIEQPLQTEAGA
ncbi:hypothetical protein FGK63_16615 [Ruegeria sediminis]|uniref:DUF707 domain-containing protein n=1 Tax=Ruegeria sediminis TaxID=2583820 RepID=A0ABY2WUG2_9RHOB|nr:hypothetical protein [Ruegeria sediminis]TMV05663.1 hypothetical protein FGK63_16615 [Ruegeria sediminis]